MAARLAVLGPTEVLLDGVAVRLRSARQRRLLAALVLWRRGASVERLADAVWGDAPPRDPAGALANQIARVRELLGASAIESVSGGYRLSSTVTCDVDELDPESPWRGWPYEDLDLDEAQVEAARLAEQWLEVRAARVEDLLRSGEGAQAVARAAALASEHPTRERARILLAQALTSAGRRTEALRELDDLRRSLVQEMGVDPSSEVEILRRRLLGDDRSAVRRRPVHSPGPLVGRDELLETVLESTRHGRLVTLTGPGGVGKTALALAVAEALGSEVIDLVPLGVTVRDEDVAAAVARQLAIEPGDRDRLTDGIADALAFETGVVVLDNAEHALAGVAELVDALLTRTPARVLLTSRARLGHPNELVVDVPPLSTDGDDGGPAGQLFSMRATGARADWRVDDATAIGQLCRRLDGLPLAIELAAAQVASRTVGELVQLLDRPADLVTAAGIGRRGLSETVARSVELLELADRRVLEEVARFRGGFTAADAAVACEEIADARQVGEALDRLVRASLLTTRDRPYGTRYALLETIRDQVLDPVGGPTCPFREGHAAAVLQALERGVLDAYGPEEPLWAARLVEDRENVLAAFRYFAEVDDAPRATCTAIAAYLMAMPRRHVDLADLADAAAQLAERADDIDPTLAVEILGLAADSFAYRGEPGSARALLDRAGGVRAPSAAHRYCEAVAADLALYAGDVDAAVGHLRQARSGFEERGQAGLAAWMQATIPLARSYSGGGDEEVGAALDALREAEGTRCPSTIAFARYVLGEVLSGRDPAEAARQLRRAVDEALSVEAFFVAALARLSLATDAARRGDLVGSATLHRETITDWQRLGNWAQQATTIRMAALLLARAGRLDASVTILSGLEAVADHDPWGEDALAVAATFDAARAGLSQRDYASAADASSGFTRVTLVGYALAALDAIADSADGERRRSRP